MRSCVKGIVEMFNMECADQYCPNLRRVKELEAEVTRLNQLISTMKRCNKCGLLKPWGPHLINLCDDCVRSNLMKGNLC